MRAAWARAVWPVMVQVAAAAALVACLAALPGTGALAIVALLAVSLGLRFVPSSAPPAAPAAPVQAGVEPVFAVHVPIHAEPPGLVCATLAALAAQTRPARQVVVVDNNTADPALWQPVRDWCAGRAGFDFIHAMGVANAKAGALDIALAATDPAATQVVLVDADYAADPDLLADAAARLRADPTLAALQYPQAYAGESEVPGLAADYARFFAVDAPRADRAGAMLLTGTLSVIARDALDAGWGTRSITEDAEMGLRLLERGGRVRFVPRAGGRGLMPMSLEGLVAQRRRWVVGNLQVARMLARSPLDGARKLAVLRQLLAWHGWLLLPVAGLAASALVGAGGMSGAPGLARASAAALAVEAAVVALRAARSPAPLAAAAAGWALAWTGSLAPLQALGRAPRFERTAKFAAAAAPAPFAPATLHGVVVPVPLNAPLILGAALFAAALLQRAPALACGAALVALVAPAIRALEREIARHAAARREGPCTQPS